jgi:hypothetical protein
MMAKGSRTELLVREELERSQERLFADPALARVLVALRSKRPALKSAYILHWRPDQGEGWYTILLNGECLVQVEVDLDDMQKLPLVAEIPMAKYERTLRRVGRIRLAAARAMAHSRSGS